MDRTTMLAHCLGLPGAWSDTPWDHHDPEHPVVKVGPVGAGKIFAFIGEDSVGVKSATTREVADEWLQRYPDDASVMAYIGRSGWNTLGFAGAIPDDELLAAVEDSYGMVVARLPNRHRPSPQ